MVRQLESVLLTRWLAKFHRTKPQWKRVRLGVPANPEEAKLYSVMLRWCDAIYLDEGMVHIVEAKLKADPKAIGQLEMYQELFTVTPEFEQWQSWPIKLVLLCADLDLATSELCSKKGIRFEIWKPEEWK